MKPIIICNFTHFKCNISFCGILGKDCCATVHVFITDINQCTRYFLKLMKKIYFKSNSEQKFFKYYIYLHRIEYASKVRDCQILFPSHQYYSLMAKIEPDCNLPSNLTKTHFSCSCMAVSYPKPLDSSSINCLTLLCLSSADSETNPYPS